MKKLLLFMISAGVLAAMTGCNVQSGYSSDWSNGELTAVTNVTQSAGIPDDLKHLNVDNGFGAVHIVGTTNVSTGWAWDLTVKARTDSIAQQIAGAVTCKAQLDGDQLELVVSLPDSSKSDALSDLMKEPHSIQSDIEITVPRTVAVRVQDRFGEVAIAELGANVDAINKNGRVEIRNIDGAVQARTSFDTLLVSNIGPAMLEDQNGELRATHINGPLGASTRFGSLMAMDIRGSAGLTNQNGSIRASSILGSLNAVTRFDALVTKNIGGRATLRNQNGHIEATDIGGPLDANTSFDSLDARNISGPVHLRDRNGDVKAMQVKGDANIETSFATLNVADILGSAILKDRNGEIIASGVTGTVKASTSFATMDVTGDGSSFVCNNRNGAIRLHATSDTLTNIEANTSFDTLEVHLPAGLKPAIQARTTFAEVDSDFPVLGNLTSPAELTEAAHSVAWISLQNQNGKIRIVRE